MSGDSQVREQAFPSEASAVSSADLGLLLNLYSRLFNLNSISHIYDVSVGPCFAACGRVLEQVTENIDNRNAIKEGKVWIKRKAMLTSCQRDVACTYQCHLTWETRVP